MQSTEMESNIVLLLLKAIVLCSLTLVVFCEGTGLSGEKNEDRKRLLKSLNKPAVTTIKADNGDLFDCVDINKQPAFDHPLLKNHTIQMRPSSNPTRRENVKYASIKAAGIAFPKEGCPVGTVPIRRTSEREFSRQMSLKKFGKKSLQNGSTTAPNDGDLRVYTAGLHANGTFYGAKMYLNVWEPHTFYPSSSSIARFQIGSGPTERLSAGWMVHANSFNDYYVRLVIFWENEGQRCMNAGCPGFVHVSNKIALGSQIYPVSTAHGVQYEIGLMVYLDVLGGRNWWLTYEDEYVGYWPKELFSSLSKVADEIHWEGMVDSFGNDPSPEMGSGHEAERGYKQACYMRALEVVTEGNKLVDPPPTQVQPAAPCFTVKDMGYINWGKTFFFGGPGGSCSPPPNQL